MKPTLLYVKCKFEEFNKLIFRNELPLPVVKLSSARTTLGKLRYVKSINVWGGVMYSDFQLFISKNLDLEESVVEDTIIHEMIHYYILLNHMKDNSSHGLLFRSIMDDINQKYGRHITISHKMTPKEHDDNRDNKLRVVGISTLCDGRIGVTVAARSRLLLIMNEMKEMPRVAFTKWYVTRDPYFSRFPKALKPKAYIVPSEIVEAHKADFTPIG